MIKLKDLLYEMYNVSIQPIYFMRFGGLSPVPQQGYGKESFHAPPARKGIYAFVWPFIEKFLLGGGYGDPKVKGANRMMYVRDKDGNIITSDHPDYEKISEKHPKYWDVTIETEKVKDEDDGEEYERPKKTALAQHVKPKKFRYEGELWHHLKDTTPVGEILDEKGDWVKTNFQTYRKALSKELHNMDVEHMRNEKEMNLAGTWRTKNPARGSVWDHLEVFIERLH